MDVSSVDITLSSDGTVSDSGLAAAGLVNLTGLTAMRTVRGLSWSTTVGDYFPLKTLRNMSSTHDVKLTHEDTNATAKDRFTLPGSVSYFLRPGESVEVRYDYTAQRIVVEDAVIPGFWRNRVTNAKKKFRLTDKGTGLHPDDITDQDCTPTIHDLIDVAKISGAEIIIPPVDIGQYYRVATPITIPSAFNRKRLTIRGEIPAAQHMNGIRGSAAWGTSGQTNSYCGAVFRPDSGVSAAFAFKDADSGGSTLSLILHDLIVIGPDTGDTDGFVFQEGTHNINVDAWRLYAGNCRRGFWIQELNSNGFFSRCTARGCDEGLYLERVANGVIGDIEFNNWSLETCIRGLCLNGFSLLFHKTLFQYNTIDVDVLPGGIGHVNFLGMNYFEGSFVFFRANDANHYSSCQDLHIDNAVFSEGPKAFDGASVDPGTDVITLEGHRLVDKIPLRLSGAGIPGGLASGTDYWTKVTTPDTFELYTDEALTSKANLTGAGSGTVTMNATEFLRGYRIRIGPGGRAPYKRVVFDGGGGHVVDAGKTENTDIVPMNLAQVVVRAPHTDPNVLSWASALTLDVGFGQKNYWVQVQGDTTFTLDGNPPVDSEVTLIVRQDASGGRRVTVTNALGQSFPDRGPALSYLVLRFKRSWNGSQWHQVGGYPRWMIAAAGTNFGPLESQSGSDTISAGTTSKVVNLPVAEPDASYKIKTLVALPTASAAAGSTRLFVTGKTTTQFTVHTEVDPGGAESVAFDWAIGR